MLKRADQGIAIDAIDGSRAGAERAARPPFPTSTAPSACKAPTRAGSRPSWAPAISWRSATWTRATGPPRSPAAPSSATRCWSSRSSPTSWRSCCRRCARGSPSPRAATWRRPAATPIRAGPPIRCGLPAEFAIIATDIAEVIGTAIGLNLLFNIPLEIGVLLTALDVFLILYLQRLGFRYLEALIITLLGVIAACFAVQIALANPEWGAADPRLRADHRDRAQPGHALSGAWASSAPP